MKSLFIIAVCICIVNSVAAQQKKIPEDLNQFIIPDYEMLDFATGDLNNDKKTDAVLILRRIGEDTLLEEDFHRPFLLLIRQNNDQLTQVVRNDDLVMCRRCGGVFGDPYEQVDISNNSFSISFYGGSAWRWMYEYQFAWKPQKKNWYLVREEKSGFNSTDPVMTTTSAEIKEAELGEVPLETFTSEPQYEDSRWRVNISKTFFYDSPQLKSKPRKGYLIKGNTVTGVRHLKNFIEVSYDNGKGAFTYGYILKKDLIRIK